jgi:hypothetical protein
LGSKVAESAADLMIFFLSVTFCSDERACCIGIARGGGV